VTREQLAAGPHRARLRGLGERAHVRGVARSKALGHQHSDRLADELRPRIAKERRRLRVGERNVSVSIDDDHRVGGALE